MKTKAFTLVELLVVIAIIGVLAALGLSVSNAAIKNAQATKCLASLRQIGVAMRAYVNENDGRLPNTDHERGEDGTSRSWVHTLAPYLGKDFIGRCPSNPDARAKITYAWNDQLAENGQGIPAARCQAPASTLAVGECTDSNITEHFHFASARGRFTYNQFKAQVSLERHGKGANYLFVDGHVESVSPTDIKTRLEATDSKFLKP